MSLGSWVQLTVLVAMLAVSTPLLGTYMAKVFGGVKAPGDRVFAPIERGIYRLCGIDPEGEQRWRAYATSVVAFSAVCVLGLFLLQRVQAWLPLNPDDLPNVPSFLAFNTAVSFVTNTNWQNYSGESTMTHLTQMAGLAVQNFVSAAVGIAVAVALVRGLTRRRAGTIGNFWVDLTRATLRLLVPIALVGALTLVGLGLIQNFSGFTEVATVEGATQQIPGGPVASQEVIKLLGTNGGGFFNGNSSHPFENPNPTTNILEIWLMLCIPFALTWTYGRLAGDLRQGLAVLGAMVVLWVSAAGLTMWMEGRSNPRLEGTAVTQVRTDTATGGNMEGKESRFGPPGSGLFATTATGTSTGAVNAMHDSFTPLGGMVPLVNMMLGEVSPGGVGSGLYGMLVFAILAVFVAGLMVGRTPEYLGKKIEAGEVKLVVLYILIVPVVVLVFAGISVLLGTARASILNPGPHGLSEVVYAYTSAANNNGSAFAGLTGGTDWYNITLGLAMLFGRFLLIVPVLAIAGAVAQKNHTPMSLGTFPTGTPTFTGLLVAIVLIVVGLTYIPVLALGPIVESLVA
ncbi:MAG: potassium-transporting ATPase subunit KdpA [Acidimicrobiia bacterium]|nr:potassium-transporting ATPase subunit KdpA [Acidimicrobiia bacterium]